MDQESEKVRELILDAAAASFLKIGFMMGGIGSATARRGLPDLIADR